MNEKKLEEYAQFLPEDIIAEAADIANDGTATESAKKAPGSGKSGSGRNGRTGALKYAAAGLLFVAAVAAGIVFAIKFGKKNDPNTPDDTSMTGESLPPELPTSVPGETEGPDPTLTENTTPVPIPTASVPEEQPFIPPETASFYTVIKDGTVQDAYPAFVPGYVYVATDGKAYFTTVIGVDTEKDSLFDLDPLIEREQYASEGSVVMTLKYLCDAEKEGDTLRLSTSAIYITIDFSSENDREYYESLDDNYDNENDRTKKHLDALRDLLGNGLIYRYSAGTWHELLYRVETVNSFALKLGDGKGLLTAIETSPAAANDPDITSISFEYEGGRLASSVSLYQGRRTESNYENGKLKRVLHVSAAKDTYKEILYNEGVTVEHQYNESGTDDWVVETYYDHPELLYKIEKVTEKRRNKKDQPFKVKHTETYFYYCDESRTGTYTGRLVQEESMEDVYRNRTVTEYDSRENMTLRLYEDISGYRIELKTEYVYANDELTEYFRTESESERPTSYEHVKIGPHEEHYYVEYKVPDTGEYRMVEYRPSGQKLVERFYDPEPNWEGVQRQCAIYYDENSQVEKTVPFYFIDGQWTEG
jgi:hypothetical protein